jgi:tripartite-type tricarboxylate transporter receptor subunit TctC
LTAVLSQRHNFSAIKEGGIHSIYPFLLPAKAPADVVMRMNAALKNALAQKDVIDGLAGFGLEAMPSTPTELTELLRRDTAKWAPIVKSVGFSADA